MSIKSENQKDKYKKFANKMRLKKQTTGNDSLICT